MAKESHRNLIRAEQKSTMGPTVLGQSWALIKRYLITLTRSPICSLIRVLLWPGFVIGFGIYLLSNITGDDSYLGQASMLVGIPQVITWLTAFHTYHFAGWLISDKSTGMKSLMISMGLKRSSYYIGNSICFTACVLPLTIVVGALTFHYLMHDSSLLTLMTIMILFVIHLVGLIFAITSFITSTTYAGLLLVLVTLEPLLHKGVLSLMKQSSDTWRPLILFMASFSPYESLRILFDSYTLCKNCGDTLYDEEKKLVAQPVYLILIAMILWTIATFAFSRWFEEVCPWQTDSAVKRPLFCLNFGQRSNREPLASDTSVRGQSKYFEKPAGHREVGISIINVTKTFKNLPVVDNLSFDIFRGETTLLLGHNGAGKTTLMNIILGKLTSEVGTVLINHSDSNMTTSRESVGVCPQSSILDDNLSVRQHLDLFAGIKTSGISNLELDCHIKTTIKDVSLASHMYKLPNELSGGMKRKLSLALAFVGKSSILILDEPSSGLDPDSRVSVWNVIRRYRADRTVLLSTQHMEEADYLGDRIAIMSNGRIICSGSSIFLNNIFGNGYKLRIECHASRQKEILAFIRGYFPLAKPSEVDQTISPSPDSLRKDPIQDVVIELTNDGSKDLESSLIKMLEEIENRSHDLHIKSHGLKSSSLEDVLLNTSKGFDGPEHGAIQIGSTAISGHIATLANPPKVSSNSPCSDFTLFMHSFMAKHLQTYKRDWPNLIFYRVVLPALGSWWLVKDLGSRSSSSEFSADFVSILMIYHFVYYPTLERVSKFKTMQLTSHATFVAYWISQYLIDLISILVISFSFDLFMLITFEGQFISSKLLVLSLSTLTMFLFGTSAAFLAYLMSTILSDHKNSTGFNLLFYCIGYLSSLILMILNLLVSPKFKQVKDVFDSILIAAMPTFSSGYVIYGLRANCYVKHSGLSAPECQEAGYWSPVVAGLTALVGQVLAYSTILYIIERANIDLSIYFNPRYISCFSCVAPRAAGDVQTDSDVLEESAKVSTIINNVPSGSYSLVAANLSKSYRRGHKVVDNLSFSVNKQECFGLLGVNGAGKTTTFSMIVAETPPDEGRLWMNGRYLSKNVDKYRQRLGYDPQVCPEMSLTPIEALHLMARLRRINELNIPMLVSSTLELLEMTEHASKSAKNLSGGTKRKLSLGMSLIGNPSLLALDEPTAGVDPIARRSIWQLLRSLRMQNGASIIISSHAMEECEAICDRISIMAKGRLRCIGSFLHLRSKFSQGCTVRVQFSASASASSSELDIGGNADLINRVVSELSRSLETTVGPNKTRLADTNINSATFSVLDNHVKRSSLFKILRDFRQRHPNMSYMINDCSLEDIFIALAREQQQLEQ